METKKQEFIDPNELMRYINENHSYAGLPMAAHICTMELLTYAPRVDAVEVERLGKLGRLMVPYKGCPRGRRGPRGFAPNTTPEEILEEVVKDVYDMGVITDVEGDQWIPVIKEDLEFLIRGCRKSVGDSHGPEGPRNDRQDEGGARMEENHGGNEADN